MYAWIPPPRTVLAGSWAWYCTKAAALFVCLAREITI